MPGYRTHKCGELRSSHVGERVRLAGWVQRKRDHKGVVFIDLRDQFGTTQLVMEAATDLYAQALRLSRESVITVSGLVVARAPEAVNDTLPTGAIELSVDEMEILGSAETVPFSSADDQDVSESLRLTYRFLDLRRKEMQENIILRSQVITSLRRRMTDLGFLEIQTPILTSSSPEGARDYLVPSRIHPGKFYALPQAPQQFKQLLMVSGFDRYFQIAPCFRDEDARADRSPGEFYQLDLEMAFVEQEDVFAVVENVLTGVFEEFGQWPVYPPPFVRLSYAEALSKYGTDKPDLRFGLEIEDVTSIAGSSGFGVFRDVAEQGGLVNMICVPAIADKPRSFFDGLDRYVKEEGGKGLAYLLFAENGVKGSIASALGADTVQSLTGLAGAEPGCGLMFLAGPRKKTQELAGKLRVRLADLLELREENTYRFCWILDFPMFEYSEESQKIEFSHNPFSMPQGGMEALLNKPPLDVLAYQYDIVCNGIELSSGAIRNHSPEIMYKAFEIAGYGPDVVDKKFGGMIRAFKFGAPPHGGIAPGVDRIVMLLANKKNIREVIAFPMNQNAQDLLMNAPNTVSEAQLKELHIQLDLPQDEKNRTGEA